MMIRATYEQPIAPYERAGRKEFLTCDGAVDHGIWEEVVEATDRSTRDEWITTVLDPRVLQLEKTIRDPQNASDPSEVLGPGWRREENTFVNESSRASQRLEFDPPGRSGSTFSLTTEVTGSLTFGQWRHSIKGVTQFGQLSLDQIEEAYLLS